MKHNTLKLCTLCVCIAVAGIIISSHSKAAAQNLGCFEVTFDSTICGPVFYGSESNGFITVANIEDAPKTISDINFIGGDSSEFHASTSEFPITIPARQIKKIAIFFTPFVPKLDGSDEFNSSISLQSLDLSGGKSSKYTIHATAIRPTEFNAISPFDRTSVLPTLKMTGTGDNFGQTFLFQCTDTISLKVISISSGNEDVHFTITPMGACSGLPMLAMPGELMAVRITLRASDSKMYYNQLRFVLGNGAAIVYNIEAMRIIPQASVNTQITAAEIFNFSTMPNPSHGNITVGIAGANNANIEIFDATGKLLITKKNISTWTWNGQTSDGTPVPSGNYFVRATRYGATGNAIVNTKRVAIIK